MNSQALFWRLGGGLLGALCWSSTFIATDVAAADHNMGWTCMTKNHKVCGSTQRIRVGHEKHIDAINILQSHLHVGQHNLICLPYTPV